MLAIVHKMQNYKSHTFYWLLMMSILIVFIGNSWSNYGYASFFVLAMSPGVMGTTYYFNFYLVPRYYMLKRHFSFILYSFYTVILSLYFQVAVVLMAFIYIGDYNLRNLPPNASDVLLIGMIFYFVVLLGSFALLIQQIQDKQNKIEELESQQAKYKIESIVVRSNRKSVEIRINDIRYIESRSDYILIHTGNATVKTKERISAIQNKLPPTLIRIHRSFIVFLFWFFHYILNIHGQTHETTIGLHGIFLSLK